MYITPTPRSAVINRYGFNSEGVDAAARRLAAFRAKQVGGRGRA